MNYEEISNLYDNAIICIKVNTSQSAQDEHVEACRHMMGKYGVDIKNAADDLLDKLSCDDEDYDERLNEWFNLNNWIKAGK